MLNKYGESVEKCIGMNKRRVRVEVKRREKKKEVKVVGL